MSEPTNEREAEAPVGPPLGSLPSAVAAVPVRRVRRRSSSRRKASVPGSGQSTGDPLSDLTYLQGRVLADTQLRFTRIYKHAVTGAIRAWRWLQKRRQRQLASKRLGLCETVSLGEKRFVAIIEVDRQQFLVGGAAGSVSMLARLNEQDEFAGVLRRRRKSSGAVQ